MVASTLAAGFYRVPGTSRLVLLCGACAKRRGYWPAGFMAYRDEGDHVDCTDCGGMVE